MRQMMMPDAKRWGKILELRGRVLQRVEGIDELIPEEVRERRSYERTTLPMSRQTLKGKVIIQDEDKALEVPRKEREGIVFWTDGSRKEDDWVGCAVVWNEEERWNKSRVHLGWQKEALHVEMYAMAEAVKIADEICREKEVRRVTIFTDSQATLRRIQSDEPGPWQVFALWTMNWERAIFKRNIQVEYRWVPAHNGVAGNEEADLQATKVVYKHRGWYTETQNPLPYLNYVSFAHVSWRITKTKWEESKKEIKEIKEMRKKSRHSYRYDLVKRGGNKAVMESKKSVAARFYQLKTGHALLGKYLRRIGKRSDMKCWWCGHKYHTRDHLFKWSKQWKREQKRLWNDGQVGEEGYECVMKVMKKLKISLPMPLVFAEQKDSRALLHFLYHMDVGRISGVVEEVDSDHEESSDGGV
jgi:ribonuclease HI